MSSLFAGNLHPECTEATLFKKFSPAGKILNIHICRKRGSRQSLGYGYMNFAEKEVADYVLKSMNYELVKNQPIRLMWAKSDFHKYALEAKVFIKNLHESIDDRILYDIFASYGTILSSEVPTDECGKSKGIGYLQYEDESSANAAIKAVNDKLIKGLQVSVCKYQPKHKRHEKFTNIYLKHIPLHFTDGDLAGLCAKFGTIVSAKVMKDEAGHSRGFGFVCFEKFGSAKESVAELHNTILFGKPLYVGRAKTKIEREAEVLENFLCKIQCTEI